MCYHHVPQKSMLSYQNYFPSTPYVYQLYLQTPNLLFTKRRVTHIHSFVHSFIHSFIRSFNQFYLATLCVSVVFSVARCPSVTLVLCIQTAEDIVKLRYRPGIPIILVF